MKIENAKEILLDNKSQKYLLIQVNETSIPHLHKVHQDLVKRLEDELSSPVVIVPSRKITNGNLYRRYRGKKAPRNKTLTANYAAALEDVLYPATIVGMRIRYPTGGSKVYKVTIDPLDKEFIEYKIPAIVSSYKYLTSRALTIDFPNVDKADKN